MVKVGGKSLTYQKWEMHGKRAKQIQKSLGTRVAAGYLRNNGWTLYNAYSCLIFG